MKMKNACVILNYNDFTTTIKLIKKIYNYKKIDYIVIVENCSNDESYSQLKIIQNQRIHVLQTKVNGGYGYGNNYGIKYAKEKLEVSYVLIANPDVEFSESCFVKMEKVLKNDKECGAVTALQVNRRGELFRAIAWRQRGVVYETLSASVLLARFLKGKTEYSISNITNQEAVVDIIPGSLVFLNVEHFIRAGMYDENVFLYCEEKILAWKYAKTGIKTKLLTNEKYTHNHSITIDKNIRSHYKKTKIWLDSKKYFIKKYMLDDDTAKKTLIDLFFCYALIEAYIVGMVKVLYKKFREMVKNDD